MSAHGTWQQAGGGGGTGPAVVIGAAVLAGSGALAGAVAALASLLEVVLACTLAAVLILAAAGFLIWRKYGYHPAPVREQVAASRKAQQVRAEQRPAIAAPAQHVHIHLGDADPSVVPAVLRAIRDGDQR